MFEDLLDDEESFEPQEPEGLAEPRSNAGFIGHKGKEQFIIDLANKDTMPHALVLAGPKGIGKATFGYRIARALLKKGIPDPDQGGLFGEEEPAPLESLYVAPDDPVFTKLASGGHPDFVALERPMDDRKGKRKDALDIDTVRKVAPFLRMTSSDGGWRIVLIDDADTMNRNAQNAVLKVLEEPPKNTLLILICHRAGALIPTIRSRCRFIAFDPLSNEEVIELLRKEYPGEPAADLDRIARIAEGSVGRAMKLMDEGGLDTVQSIIDILHYWEKWDWTLVHHLSDTLGRAGQDTAYKNFTSLLEWIMGEMLFAKARGDIALEAPLDHQPLRNMLSHYSLEDWTKICDNLRTHFETFDRSNLDKRQAVLGAFSIIG